MPACVVRLTMIAITARMSTRLHIPDRFVKVAKRCMHFSEPFGSNVLYSCLKLNIYNTRQTNYCCGCFCKGKSRKTDHTNSHIVARSLVFPRLHSNPQCMKQCIYRAHACKYPSIDSCVKFGKSKIHEN